MSDLENFPTFDAAPGATEAHAARESQLREENAKLAKQLATANDANLLASAKVAEAEKAAEGGGGAKPPRLKKDERERFNAIDAEHLADPRKRRALSDDIEWALQQIDNDGPDGVKAIEAPSRAAWSMLFMARFNRMKFYEKFVPMLQKKQDAAGPTNQGGLGVTDDDEGVEVERIRGELKKAVKASAKAKA